MSNTKMTKRKPPPQKKKNQKNRTNIKPQEQA